MQALAIVILCIGAAVSYGILHDQITARVCIEYFTIGHPQILRFPTDSPTILGFVWGIAATWWVGVGLGVPLAAAARLGKWRKTDCGELVRPILRLMLIAGVLATLSGLLGYFAASLGWISLSGRIGTEVAAQQHAAFLADAFSHTTSYFVGAFGGFWLILKTWLTRRSPASATML
jgi:hypothetical protein